MKKISTITKFRQWRECITDSIGFVPTMGSLHEGHLSLVKKSNETCAITVVSIFVNPAQFAPTEDLNSYPRNLEADLQKLADYNVDCIFLPDDMQMYPQGFSSKVSEHLLSKELEGKSRPVFFPGVTTIVAKLFNIVEPSHAFFGDKDAQQLSIIRRIVLDLNFPITIIGCPIIREENGLAMSSRNSYLSNEEYKIAVSISKALQSGKNLLISGEKSAQVLRDKITRLISSHPQMRIDYISVANNSTLLEIAGNLEGEVLVSVAVYLGGTRLIDNFCYSVSSKRK